MDEGPDLDIGKLLQQWKRVFRPSLIGDRLQLVLQLASVTKQIPLF